MCNVQNRFFAPRRFVQEVLANLRLRFDVRTDVRQQQVIVRAHDVVENGLEDSRFAGAEHIRIQRVHNAADARVGIVQFPRVVRMFVVDFLDFRRCQTEQVEVFGADFFADLDRKSVV